jgi:hypothetical protein
MIHSVRPVLAVLVSFVFAVGLSAQGTPDAAGAIATVPMSDFGGRPVVEVSINGGGPYRLILDTGASITNVNPEWIAGVQGMTTIKEFGLGSFTARDVRVVSRATLLGNVPADFPKGVLSALAFPGYLLTLDFPGKIVSIRKGALPAADGKRVFEYPASEILPMAPISIAGRIYNIHVDSGAGGGIMLPLKYQTVVPLAGPVAPAGTARTIAGQFDVFAAPITVPVKLGEFALDVTSVRFSDLRPGPMPGIGNFGAAVLKAFKVTVDSANRRLQFER